MARNDDRLEFVAEMTLMGYTPANIAGRLGVSEATVRKDLEKVRIRWQESRKKSYSEFVEEELETQKMLMRALEDGIKQGSWKHVETALKITERRSRVMGLDHVDRMEQARVEIEKKQLDLISHAVERMMDALGLTPEQRDLATGVLLKELEEPVIEIEAEVVDDE